MKALPIYALCALAACVSSQADEPLSPTQSLVQPKRMEKGLYIVAGRVVSGTLIANFGLNLGDIVQISDDGKTMLVLKSGRKFPLNADEPNLQPADEKLTQMKEDLRKDVEDLAKLRETLVKDEKDLKETIDKMDALIASVGTSSTIVYNQSSGTYYVASSTNAMSSEQQKLFNDLNARLGVLRKEIKQTQKRVPDAEAEVEKDKKSIAKLESDLASWRKDNPSSAPAPALDDKALREKLTKLKALFNDGLLTKEQYDHCVYEAVNAGKAD